MRGVKKMEGGSLTEDRSIVIDNGRPNKNMKTKRKRIPASLWIHHLHTLWYEAETINEEREKQRRN